MVMWGECWHLYVSLSFSKFLQTLLFLTYTITSWNKKQLLSQFIDLKIKSQRIEETCLIWNKPGYFMSGPVLCLQYTFYQVLLWKSSIRLPGVNFKFILMASLYEVCGIKVQCDWWVMWLIDSRPYASLELKHTLDLVDVSVDLGPTYSLLSFTFPSNISLLLLGYLGVNFHLDTTRQTWTNHQWGRYLNSKCIHPIYNSNIKRGL
jgi:hypothetical protein